MASVQLAEVWLHNADDLSDAVRLRTARLSQTTSVGGQVRQYAGGVRRIVTTKARTRPITVTCEVIARDVFDRVIGWQGRELLLRDPFGRVEFGTLFDATVDEESGLDLVNVTFEFWTTTRTVEV